MLRFAISITFIFVCVSVSATPPSAALSDFDKEALTVVKDMTSNLLYLAVGVFALVGGYLASSESTSVFKTWWRKFVLLTAFFFFGLSLIAGLIVFMALADQLLLGEFKPQAAWIRGGSTTQILSAGTGAFFFFLFLITNIGFRE